VLYLESATYDPSTRTLAVRYHGLGGAAWAVYEYRDVRAELYNQVLAAMPHGQRVIDTSIAPFHEVRRRGESGWRAEHPDPEQLRSVDARLG
jgi:hypothetical protein